MVHIKLKNYLMQQIKIKKNNLMVQIKLKKKQSHGTTQIKEPCHCINKV